MRDKVSRPDRPRPAFLHCSGLVLLIACKGGGGDVPECSAALHEIDSSCAAPELTDTMRQACDRARQAVSGLAETGMSTGKTEMAAEGCARQAEIVESMIARASPAATATATADPRGAEPEPAGVEPEPAGVEPATAAAHGKPGSPGGACDELDQEVESACGDLSGLNASQEAICAIAKKSVAAITDLAQRNPDAAEQACKATRGRFAEKGGLEKMVAERAK